MPDVERRSSDGSGRCVDIRDPASLASTALRALPDTAAFAFDERLLCTSWIAGDGFVTWLPEPIGRPSSEVIPDDSGEIHLALRRALRGTEVTCGPRSADGRSLRIRAIPARTAGEATSRAVVAVVRDVTALDAVERLVLSRIRRFRAIVDDGSDVISTHDERGMFLSAPASAERLFGWREEDLLGRTLADVAHREDQDRVTEAVIQAAREDARTVTVTFRAHAEGGEARWAEARLRAAPPDADAAVLASTRDISQRKSLEDELRYLADHDALTGAVNRRRFEAELDRELRSPHSRAGLLVIDLDGFKSINDQHGHLVGDEVLRSVAHALDSELRPGDVVGRWGGDEFAALLRRAGEADLQRVAGRMLSALRTVRVPAGDGAVGVTASIGAAHLRSHASPDAALDAADRAMYRAKRRGRDQVAVER